MRSKARVSLPARWDEFLTAVGRAIPIRIEVHCIGALAAGARYGLPMAGQAVDYIATLPPSGVDALRTNAGEDSALAARHELYFRFFGSGEHVQNYELRLQPIFPGHFGNIHLFGLEAHDLALVHLGSRAASHVALARQLAQRSLIKLRVLRKRYREEVRPLVADPQRTDRAFHDWLERIF